MTRACVLDTAFGVVVATPVAKLSKAELLARLHAKEAAIAASWGEPRVRTFVAGRLALREALRAAGVDVDAIGRDDRGAPIVGDERVRVSVSHKDEIAVALAWRPARADERVHVGVDVELLPGPKEDVARHVLTDVEQQELASIGDHGVRRRELVARFSVKEALYKALDPFVQRYVGFHEVEVRLHADGGAAFSLQLKDGEGPFVVEAEHRDIDGGVLTFARVRRA